MKKHVLLDVDGVLADFTGAYLRAVYEETGRQYTVEAMNTYSLRDYCQLSPQEEKKLDRRVCEEGFAYNLDPLPGLEGAARLIAEHDVRVVTSPWHSSRHWYGERVAWLWDHLRFPAKKVIFAGEKHPVWGDVLIDDKTETVQTWAGRWPRGRAVLWNAPWNQDAGEGSTIRARSWDDVFRVLES